MKNNRVLIYALIISIAAHSVLILFLLRAPKKEKKHSQYTKPILVEPYKFIKNLEKFKVNKPKYASIKPHFAKQNTRLNAPSSYTNPSPESSFTPPAPYRKIYANRNRNVERSNQNRRVITNSHIFSTNRQPAPRRNQRLSNLYPMGRQFFNPNAAAQSPSTPSSGIKNPSHGIKSATVNLNTTTIKYASYLLHVKNKIENVWEYPVRARRQGLSGLLVIKFTINRNGSIYKVSVLRSSGHKMLDKAAVKAIYNGSRYNPFPNYWKIKRLNIIGTFIYRLSNFYLY